MRWRIGKYITWVVGYATLLYSFFRMDFGDLANWIQFFDGVAGIFALGIFVEHILPNIKHLKHLPKIHDMLKELHEFHLGGKDDDERK